MKGKLRLALYGFVITALLLGASPALADEPTLPHAFYGTVTINGADAPVGSVVSAEVGGVDCGSYSIGVAGRYGNLDERDYLTVQGDIASGDTITFYINDVSTGQTETFEAGGGPTQVDLTVPETVPSVATSAATSVTTSSATLNGNLGSLGTALSVEVSFEWGTTTAYGNTATVTASPLSVPGVFSASLSGLGSGTTYHFRTKAVGHGTSYGIDSTFTTGTVPTVPPAVTTDPATGVTTTLATLNGSLTDLGTALSVDVSFEWGTTTAYGNETTPRAMTSTGAFSFSLSGLSTDTTYHFRAKAVGDSTSYGLDRSFTTGVKKVATIPPGQTDYVVDASDIADTTITVDTTAEVTITVTKYATNPHPEVPLPASMLPRYIDIEVDNADAIVWPMHVEQAYADAEVAGLDESSLGMYYFKDAVWHRCSDTGVNTAANYVWANMTRDELSGSPVAVGGTAVVPRPAAGGGGGLPAPPAGTTDVRGMVSGPGVFTRTVTATSEDELCTLTIPEGTVGLTEELEPLDEITMVIMDEPPDLPEDAYIIGLAYDFSPDGATFDPPITLTWSYNPAALPEGVAEEDTVLAYYDEDAGEWVELDCVVDTENNTITASVPHFTTFAIIGIPPTAFTCSLLIISPTGIAPAEKVNISVSVANTGGREGSYAVVLKINGVKEAEKSVTIAAGSSQSVGFSVAKEEAGSYDVVVDGLSGSFTVVALPAPPPPLAPAAFSLSKLSVKPAEVKPNEPVTITVSVANTGGTEGSYTVVLKINGVKEAEKSATVAAGESQDVSFTPVTKEQAGSYSVDVDGLSATFTVSEVAPPVPPVPVPTAPPAKPPINWPLAGGIIAAVVVVGLVVFFLVRRRAY